MYETTSLDTASFGVFTNTYEWDFELLGKFPEHYAFHRALPSDYQPENDLYQRKPSLVDRILAIAGSVPEKEWEKLPVDMAEKYRDYKRNTKK